MKSRAIFLAFLIGGAPAVSRAPLHAQQGAPPPARRIGQVHGVLRLDGRLNEAMWADADSISDRTQSRLRWTFSPLGDLFVVYNHNLRHDIDPATGLPVPMGIQTDPMRRRDRRWGFGSNQLLVKLPYAVRD